MWLFSFECSQNYKNVLILEDDFEFVVSKEEFEKSIQQFFDASLNYDVLLISYIIQKSEDVPDYPFIKKIIDGQTASGYIINQTYYDTLIQLYDWAIPLLESTGEHWNYANDIVWKRIQPRDNWYFFVDRIGKQRMSYSDNKMCVVEYI